MKVVNYLGVTLDLNNGTFRPYHKPDNEISYININSNHPQNIIKQIPISIRIRFSNLSSNDLFRQVTLYYTATLQVQVWTSSPVQIQYTPTKRDQRPNNRKRNIICVNNISNNIFTTIGRFFLNLVQRHFPRNHKFHKIFNKKKVKVSYSCMSNMKTSTGTTKSF